MARPLHLLLLSLVFLNVASADETKLPPPDSKTIDFAVWDRNSLAAGQSIAGPALVEERETTTVILPGWSATVHATGCVIAERK